MTSTTAHPSNGHYFVPPKSLYSTLLSVAIFTLAFGFILRLHDVPAGVWGMLLGAGLIVYVLFGWFGQVIGENVRGVYTAWEDRSYRIGMVWFIFSEVMFFACFFGVLYYTRIISIPELSHADQAYAVFPGFDSVWPSSGPLGDPFKPMGPWGIPAVNTLLLLLSGVTLTWAHWGLLKSKRNQLIAGLVLTILLGAVFMVLQVYEYAHAYSELGLTLGAGAYGGTFFITTGFHGMHVTLGIIMLTTILGRCAKGHFSAHDHFGFEAVAWYWHFVDVVWLFVFVFVYWL